jgi:metal-responsive CopG/Arc/MetJ family transcriptional regulator
MKTKNKEKVKISISLSKDLLDVIDNNANNRSAYIEHILKYYYNHLGIDVSKIKL